MKLDVIIPAYNEEGSIKTLHKELTNALKEINYKLIFIDDGSTDNTFKILEEIYNIDKDHIKVISFSRNFGKDAAIYAGLKASTAEYSCIIDADMQQNPKYIMKIYNFIEKNPEYDMIAMVNDYKNENALKGFLKKNFYKVISKLSNLNFEVGASDFRIFKNYVRDAILELSEKNRFTKGIFSYIGFNTYYMNYKVDKRISGKSKFNMRGQLNYAKEGIVNFSTKPLKLATIIGTIISLFSFFYLIYIFIITLIKGGDVPGYPSLMCVILLLGGIELLVLGIVGEYIGKNYIESKNRPVYIKKKSLGFDNNIL